MYAVGQRVRIEFYKYPEQRLHYWWEAVVAEVRPRSPGPEGVLVHMPVGFEFHHETLGRVFRPRHQAYVAFFPGRWYSGGPDLDPEGRVLAYYWNVQTPPVFEPGRIWQYDLELDVYCGADHACEVRDMAEFRARRHLYPAEWVACAQRAVEEVMAHLREGRWPVLPPTEPRGVPAGPWPAIS